MPPLPEKVGQGYGGREGEAEPQPEMAHGLTKRREENADHQSREPEADPVFVQHRNSHQSADEKPKMLVAGLGDAHDEISYRRPEWRVEGIHGEQVRKS